jgi:hypothetical protein
MRTLEHFRRSRDSHLHAHPFHTLFALVAGFVLAILAVLILIVPAK